MTRWYIAVAVLGVLMAYACNTILALALNAYLRTD